LDPVKEVLNASTLEDTIVLKVNEKNEAVLDGVDNIVIYYQSQPLKLQNCTQYKLKVDELDSIQAHLKLNIPNIIYDNCNEDTLYRMGYYIAIISNKKILNYMHLRGCPLVIRNLKERCSAIKTFYNFSMYY
jgi:hypothetical protein